MIYTHAAALLIGAAAAGFTAWQVQNWRHDALEKDRLEREAKERGIQLQRIDTAAAGHERDKSEIQTKFVTITEEVERVVQVPFYVAGDQCLDADGLRVLTDAIGAAAPAGQPAAAVPRPAASR